MASNAFFDTSDLTYTYTNVDNSVIDDADLKPEHLGVMLLIYRYKNMDRCSLSVKFLASKCECSYERMLKICKDLEAHGYLERDVFRDRKGQTATIFRVHTDPKGIAKEYVKTPSEPEAPETEADTQAGEQLTLEGAPVKEVSASKKTAKTAQFETEFEDVWKSYPRKQGKMEAKAAYVKARKAGTSKEIIADAVAKFATEVKRKDTPTDYIPYGSTWFGKKRWNDYDEIAPATTGGDAGTEAIVTEIYKTAAASTYNSLSAQAKTMISEKQFEELQAIEAGSYCNEPQKYKEVIRGMIK